MKITSTNPQPDTSAIRIGSPAVPLTHVLPALENSSWRVCQDIPEFSLQELDDDHLVLERPLAEADQVFGLGQVIGPLNKRGFSYRALCLQTAPHSPDKNAANTCFPFLMLRGANNQSFGLYLCSSQECLIDIGFTDPHLLSIKIPKNYCDVIFYSGDTLSQITALHHRLLGQPYVPPRWGFGYQQCRYSYETSERVREIAAGFKSHRIPCSAIYLDIDYMDDYKSFTVDEETFPDIAALSKELAADDVKLLAIIDPAIKVEAGYEVYESGVKNKYFCLDADGERYTPYVWPGQTHLPDFFSEKTRQWWGQQYKQLTDLGIAGFWNDMNEPELFFTDKEMDSCREVFSATDQRKFRDRDAVDFLPTITSFWQNEKYYDEFYHQPNETTSICHRELHNWYPVHMAQAVSDGLRAIDPGKRPFVLSRSGSTGSQRVTGFWTGDNNSWWNDLRVQIQMMIGLNLSGVLFTGGDVGGHNGEPSAELLVRWTQLGALSPLFRNHTVKFSRDQEPWAFGEPFTSYMRSAIELRYALMPYYYSEFLSAAVSASPFLAPLFLQDNSPVASEIDDQFFIGKDLLAAPVISPNARNRSVYLPAGRWLFWNATHWNSLDATVVDSGHRHIQAALDQLPLFLRENSLLALQDPQNEFHGNNKTLNILGLISEATELKLFSDDGESDLAKSKLSTVTVTVTPNNSGYSIEANRSDKQGHQLDFEEVRATIFNANGQEHSLTCTISR